MPNPDLEISRFQSGNPAISHGIAVECLPMVVMTVAAKKIELATSQFAGLDVFVTIIPASYASRMIVVSFTRSSWDIHGFSSENKYCISIKSG